MAVDEMQKEYQTFSDPDQSFLYDVSSLTSDGHLIRINQQNVESAHKVELIATYDQKKKICSWGFDVAIYPNLPRTAALRVREIAKEHAWPAFALVNGNMREGECLSRSALATLIGDLEFIDRISFGTNVVYFGFPPEKDSS